MLAALFLLGQTAWATSESKTEEAQKPRSKQEATTTQASSDVAAGVEAETERPSTRKELRKALKSLAKEARLKGIKKPTEIPGWGILFIVGGALWLIGIIIFVAGAGSINFGLLWLGWLLAAFGSIAVLAAFIWMLVDLLS